MIHCWKDYRTHLEEQGQIYSQAWTDTYLDGNKTCLLEAGHTGKHEFTNDSAIEVTFKDSVTTEGV